METKPCKINPVAEKLQKRYDSLSLEIKKELEEFDKINPREYQLKKIKKTKNEIKTGDVFLLSPREGIYFYGKVLNAYIKNIDKDIFIDQKHLVFIFKCKTKNIGMEDFKPNYLDLLIKPAIVDESYWTKGMFYTVGNIPINEAESNLDYGFLKFGINSNWFVKDDGTELNYQPSILGIHGISTITGIASQIGEELIIDPTILEFSK